MSGQQFTDEELFDHFGEFQAEIMTLVGELTQAWHDGKISEVPLNLDELFDAPGVSDLFSIASTNTVYRSQNDFDLMLAMAAAPTVNSALAIVAKAGVVLGFILGYLFNTDEVKNLLATVQDYIDSPQQKASSIRFSEEADAKQMGFLRKMTDDDKIIH